MHFPRDKKRLLHLWFYNAEFIELSYLTLFLILRGNN